MDLAERLRTARRNAGFETAADAARRFGWNVGGYRHHENGTSGFKHDRAQEYARAFNVSTDWLLFGRGDAGPGAQPMELTRSIPVVGKVAAGLWQEQLELEAFEPTEFLHLSVEGYERATLRALQIDGPSMNEVYPPGRYVVYAPPAEAGLRDGDFVIVRRSRSGFFETTCKELIQEGGRVKLQPRSTDPNHQTPIYLDAGDEASQDGVEIIGVVVADYARRVRPPPPVL